MNDDTFKRWLEHRKAEMPEDSRFVGEVMREVRAHHRDTRSSKQRSRWFGLLAWGDVKKVETGPLVLSSTGGVIHLATMILFLFCS